MTTLPPIPPPPIYDQMLKGDGKLNESWQKWFSLLQLTIQTSAFGAMTAKTFVATSANTLTEVAATLNSLLFTELTAPTIPPAPTSGVVVYAKTDKNLYAKNSTGAEVNLTSFP